MIPPPYEINLLKEVYFKDSNVQKFLEYQPGKFAVCLYKDDAIFLVDRVHASIQRVKKPGGKSCCYEIFPIPNFNPLTMPYLLMRDDKNLYLVCIKEQKQKVTVVEQARYESKQRYKTMEVIANPNNQNEFNLAVLTHQNDQTSKISLFHFDSEFFKAIVEKSNF